VCGTEIWFKQSPPLRFNVAMRIRLDVDRCQGHGRCYDLAPDLFDADEDGHAIILAPDVPAESEDQAVLAVNNCPERALSLEA
jgi:ferredoxin